jgi:4-hydroxybenzoate polyprenyltransferase
VYYNLAVHAGDTIRVKLAQPIASSTNAAARYVSCLRLQEILVLQGSPMLGAACALRQPAAEYMWPLAILVAANLCLVAHIFVVNDWSNFSADLTDSNKAADVFTARGVDPKEMGGLAAALLGVSLVLFGRFGPATLSIAVGIATLSGLYSLPPFSWKGRPLLNSAAHVAGGALHFLLGYSLGHVIDRRGLLIATFFAVTFAAGHLTQELRDYDGDVRNGIRTNAVIFGKRRTFAASLALFTLSHALLLVLNLQGMLPRVLAVLVVLCPIHLRWSIQALREGLMFASICRLQARYRTLYAVIGLAVIAALWMKL